jgi:hypothetical protein
MRGPHEFTYSLGRLSVAVSAVPTPARALGATVEALAGEKPSPTRRGSAPKLQQQIKRITQLPKQQQRFVMQMLDAVLAQQGRLACA